MNRYILNDLSEVGDHMKSCWVAKREGEDIIGIFSTREKAVECLYKIWFEDHIDLSLESFQDLYNCFKKTENLTSHPIFDQILAILESFDFESNDDIEAIRKVYELTQELNPLIKGKTFEGPLKMVGSRPSKAIFRNYSFSGLFDYYLIEEFEIDPEYDPEYYL